MMDYIPLHLDPLEREPKLKPWLESVMKGLGAHFKALKAGLMMDMDMVPSFGPWHQLLQKLWLTS
jgi:hypothetical protein